MNTQFIICTAVRFVIAVIWALWLSAFFGVMSGRLSEPSEFRDVIIAGVFLAVGTGHGWPLLRNDGEMGAR